MVQVIIVDDHRLFRMGLKTAFKFEHSDIQIIGEADCGDALFRLPALAAADLVLLDILLPDMSGIEIASRLRSEYPAIKILAVSTENSAATVKAMLEAGIDGFISKQQGDTNELAEAIRAVMNDLNYFGCDISSIIYDVYITKRKTSANPIEFTAREKEIISLCRDGLMCKEIAANLGISIRTVNTHKERIFTKLGINSTMEMVQYALKHGIIRVEN